MEHGAELTNVAILATVALVCGLLLSALRQPAIVGYILAGVILGPSGLALVHDREQITFLAELGVLLLLFAIGMELSIAAFRSVLSFAVAGTGLQVGVSVAVMLVLALVFDWSWERAITLGFGVALSSTAVAIKILDDVGELRRETGKRAVGILIAQDIAIVPMMLIIAALAPGESFEATDLAPLVGAIVFLALFIWFLGRRDKVRLPFRNLTHGQADLITLAALAYCFAAASISGLFGLSAAYGAFLAGLLLGNSTDRKAMHRVTLPLQGVLLMVFFLSIGLLIDLAYIWANLGEVLLLLLLVTVGKTALNVVILRFLGEPLERAWLGGLALGQVGEFSFVLAALALSVGVIDPAGNRLFVAVIALSLMTSPFWFDAARRLERLATRRAVSVGDMVERLYPGTSATWHRLASATRGLRRARRRPPAAEASASGEPTDAPDGPPDEESRDDDGTGDDEKQTRPGP